MKPFSRAKKQNADMHASFNFQFFSAFQSSYLSTLTAIELRVFPKPVQYSVECYEYAKQTDEMKQVKILFLQIQFEKQT